MTHFLTVLLLLSLFALNAQAKGPVIGIYTQDSSSFPGRTYLFSSPVKYLEIAGAQIVPLHYNSSEQELTKALSQLNGVLFPGGNISIDIQNRWTQNADFVLKYAIQQNDKGNVFPIYGICQGHQLLSYLTSGYDSKVLQTVDGQTPAVNSVEYLSKSSYILTNFTQDLFKATTTRPGVLQYDHYWAIYETYFNNNPKLNGFWNLVATSTTTCCNQTYTAIMEAKNYPFYTVQFHSESNLFSTKIDASRNTFQAVEVSQRLIQAFVEKAKSNNNQFNSDQDLYKSLIYNYPMTKFNRTTQGKQSYLMDR